MIRSALGLSAAQVRSVLQAGGRAPSLHNSQPWRMRIESDRIELHADDARRLPAADPDDRELRLGCGAALLNMRLALLDRGIEPSVVIHAGPLAEGIAVVEHGGPAAALGTDAALFRVIAQRRTNRRPFLDQPVGAAERRLLIEAAEAEHCQMRIIDDAGDQARLHRALLAAHRRQQADPEWIAEFDRWVARPGSDADGVPLSASGPEPELQDIWVLRDFSSGHAPARRQGKDFEPAPLIAVLASYFDGPLAQVQAGQAMQRVLLSATSAGLSASFLSQLIEMPDARAEVRRVIGGSLHPQVVLRIGYGSPVPAVPRRPVEDLVFDPPEERRGRHPRSASSVTNR